VGGLVDWGVVEAKTSGEPALFNLGVDINGATEVSVNTFEDSDGDLGVVSLEGIVEDDLEVRVETEVVAEVCGGGFTCTVDVI